MNSDLTRRKTIAGMMTLAASASLPTAAYGHFSGSPVLDPMETLTRIAFGSCNNQRLSQEHWQVIQNDRPQAMIMMGDNVYGDLDGQGPAFLTEAYATLARSPEFVRFGTSVPILPTWDDHDFGANDRGGSYIHRNDAKRQFLEFWNIPRSDPRHRRDGVYWAQTYGPVGRRIQIILLDLRSFRSEMVRGYDQARHAEGYAAQIDPSVTMLGADQWLWLTEQLRKPADLRLIVSSLQVIGDGGETWKHFPLERRKLFDTIRQTEAQRVIFLSGDVHTAAMYRFARNTPYPFYEFTSSSLNQGPQKLVMEEAYLLGEGVFADSNFGIISIDWAEESIRVDIKNKIGSPVRTRNVYFSEITPQ